MKKTPLFRSNAKKARVQNDFTFSDASRKGGLLKLGAKKGKICNVNEKGTRVGSWMGGSQIPW